MKVLHNTVRYGLIILALVASLAYFFLADAGHEEPRLIVIGDSLSTTHESWPNYLREQAPRWNVQVMAQNGRTIRDFSIPRDLWTPGDRNETVVYFLGTNDILQRNDIMHAKTRLKTHVDFLLGRNFKVLLLIPPTLTLDAFPEADRKLHAQITERTRALFESYRGADPNLWVYDLDEVWDNAETMDGVHPNPELSLRIAMAINWTLSLNIY